MTDTKPLRHGRQFRLRTLLTLMLAVAMFLGGWVTNEARHHYILRDNVQVEFIDGDDLVIMRGTREDVDTLADVIEDATGDDATP